MCIISRRKKFPKAPTSTKTKKKRKPVKYGLFNLKTLCKNEENMARKTKKELLKEFYIKVRSTVMADQWKKIPNKQKQVEALFKKKASIREAAIYFEAPKERKKYYYTRKTLKGKTYFSDQDGQRIAKKNLKKGRPVYITAAWNIENVAKKGEAIKTSERGKKKEVKKFPPKHARIVEQQNFNVSAEISDAIKTGKDLYSKVKGRTYKHESNKSKMDMLLFFYELNEAFYHRFKKLIDSPIFHVKTIISEKNKLFFADFDSIRIDENISAASAIGQAFKDFYRDILKLKNRYYK